MSAEMKSISDESAMNLPSTKRNVRLPYRASGKVDDALVCNSEVKRLARNIIEMRLTEADIVRMGAKILDEAVKVEDALKEAKSCGE